MICCSQIVYSLYSSLYAFFTLLVWVIGLFGILLDLVGFIELVGFVGTIDFVTLVGIIRDLLNLVVDLISKTLSQMSQIQFYTQKIRAGEIFSKHKRIDRLQATQTGKIHLDVQF